MDLLVFRHGEAEPAASGGADADRPLTKTANLMLARAARTWAVIVPPPEVIATSPLRRARETADALQVSWGSEIVYEDGLHPSADPDELLRKFPDLERLCIVGHIPFLGDLLGPLLAETDRAHLRLKAGQGLWIQLPSTLQPTPARLLVALTCESAAALCDQLGSHR